MDRTCWNCLRGISWPTIPERSHQGQVVVREGIDAFIRSPNDRHPSQAAEQNSGADPSGPVGSYYSSNGLRYLICFDIPKAFRDSGIPITEFIPERATLVLRLAPGPDCGEPVPIVVYPLARRFEEGNGKWGRHQSYDRGCTWFMATREMPWETTGGDFSYEPHSTATLPASGSAEVTIDVTDIVAWRFRQFRETGRWYDPGMLIMRDVGVPSRCRFRMIHSFQAPHPYQGNSVITPELFLE